MTSISNPAAAEKTKEIVSGCENKKVETDGAADISPSAAVKVATADEEAEDTASVKVDESDNDKEVPQEIQNAKEVIGFISNAAPEAIAETGTGVTEDGEIAAEPEVVSAKSEENKEEPVAEDVVKAASTNEEDVKEASIAGAIADSEMMDAAPTPPPTDTKDPSPPPSPLDLSQGKQTQKSQPPVKEILKNKGDVGALSAAAKEALAAEANVRASV